MPGLSPHIYFAGTAGSGKSSLAGAYHEWCLKQGLDTILVNLDPGAEGLPYEPMVDVREWVKLDEVMASEGLGPNGAQIAAADLISLQADKIKDRIATFRSDYVLIDTPGQIELFVFRQSGRFLTKFLAPDDSMIAYLMDPVLSKQPTSFVSQLLLALSVQFRLGLPVGYVLSKVDLLEEEERDRVLEWAEQPDALHAAVLEDEEGMFRELNVDLLRSMDALGSIPQLAPVSAAEIEGLEDLYALIQLHFTGGEDPMADARDAGDLLGT